MDDSGTVIFNFRSQAASPNLSTERLVDEDLPTEAENSPNSVETHHTLENTINAGDGDRSRSILDRLDLCFGEIKTELRESIQSVQNQAQVNFSEFEMKLNSLQNQIDSVANKNNSENAIEQERLSSHGHSTDHVFISSTPTNTAALLNRGDSSVAGVLSGNSRTADSRMSHVQTAETPHMKMKPSTYDGSDDLDEYLTQFNLVAELNRWSYETKSLVLASSMTGATRSLLCELQPSQRRDYDSIIAALQNRYGSVNRAELYRSQLQSKVLEKNETIPELAQTIRKLTRKAYPSASSEVVELLALDFFIDALPDTDIRLRLREVNPKSISEAERIAVRLDVHKIADRSRGRHHVRFVEPEQSQTDAKLNKLSSQLSDVMKELLSSKATDNRRDLARAHAPNYNNRNPNYKQNRNARDSSYESSYGNGKSKYREYRENGASQNFGMQGNDRRSSLRAGTRPMNKGPNKHF